VRFVSLCLAPSADDQEGNKFCLIPRNFPAKMPPTGGLTNLPKNVSVPLPKPAVVMKVFRILGFQKSHSNRVMFGAAALCLAASSFAAIVANANADVGAGQPVAVFHSSGMGEILKMLDAKVDPEIIKAYVKNSQTAYSPNAAEIIALKEHGVSSDIIVAMLQRGGELRGQAAQAATMQPQMGTPPYRPGAAPAEQYGTEPAPPNYSDYPSYSYPDYSYAYPYYSGGYYG
jgi:hypothetical protein